MSDYGTFKVGGVSYPLTASTTNTLLRDADPSLFYVIAFLSGVLKIHLEARLVAESVKANAPITKAVAYTTNVDVGQHPIDTRYRFPLLAVYRQKSKHGKRTVTWAEASGTWGVTYLLPALSVVQAETLDPILKSVEDVLVNRIEQGYDPAYNSGQKVWAAAGLESIALDAGDYGVYAIKVPQGAQYFIGWRGTLLVKEREKPESDFGKLNAVDTAIDLTNTTDGTSVPDFVDTKSDIKTPGPNG